MRWVKANPGTYHLIVLPLHGIGNKDGQGTPVNVLAYEIPKNPQSKWKHTVIDKSMHLTHNLDVVPDGQRESIYIGGKEGVRALTYENGKWVAGKSFEIQGQSFGEIRAGMDTPKLIAGIQPMHGNELVVYQNGARNVLTTELNQGHALAVSDLLGTGSQQVVAGWREPDSNGKTGIKIFVPSSGSTWSSFWLDNNGMACEDVQVADMNGDGKPEIIAAGRSTKNLKIYWNRN
jgi:hypothetical protein